MLKLISKAHAGVITLKDKYAADEKGATAIEYGLIAVGIALAILAAVKVVGTSLDAAFDKVATGLK